MSSHRGHNTWRKNDPIITSCRINYIGDRRRTLSSPISVIPFMASMSLYFARPMLLSRNDWFLVNGISQQNTPKLVNLVESFMNINHIHDYMRSIQSPLDVASDVLRMTPWVAKYDNTLTGIGKYEVNDLTYSFWHELRPLRTKNELHWYLTLLKVI